MPVKHHHKKRRLLAVQAAALGWDLVQRYGAEAGLPRDLLFAPLIAPFPAVTCTAQATFRTAAGTASHGIVGNGWLDRESRKTTFWEQSAALVRGPRFWQEARAAGVRVAMLFWQQSLGEEVDMVLSPAPIHKHGGGMLDTCYSRPAHLYGALSKRLGAPFRLRHYWGPLASVRGSRWIARATAEVLSGDLAPAPDLCMTYLPALDYDLQRHGPGHARARLALAALTEDLKLLQAACEQHGYEMVVFGDYAIREVKGEALFPNRRLREAGWLQVREVAGRCYPDLYASRAVAVVDHQVAHVYVQKQQDLAAVRDVFEKMSGLDTILDRSDQEVAGVAHARGGELLLVAAPQRWFAYPWWTRHGEEPDYAGHVDIHNKPGYDPCELFFGGWPPGSVSRDTRRIRGSHGRADTQHCACWGATCFPPRELNLMQLAQMVSGVVSTGRVGKST